MAAPPLPALLTGDYERHGDPAASECVVAFAFGRRDGPRGMRPGWSNDDLARFIVERLVDLPLIAQAEIAAVLPATRTWRSIDRHREPDKYLDTVEFAAQARMVMDREGWTTAIVVAHPFHLPYADAMLAAQKVSTVALDGLQDVRFDRRSSQAWTRSRAAWRAEVVRQGLAPRR